MSEIIGRQPVLEVLKSQQSINKLLLAKGERKGTIFEILKLAKEKRVPIQQVEKKYLDNMFPGKNHQGVVAYVSVTDYVDWQDLLARARERKEEPLLVILDEIEDPHNLGAILRTVDAVGAHGVIIPKRRAVGLTEGVAKASAGAVNYVPVARVANIAQILEALKKEGLWIVGTSLKGENLYKQNLQGPLAIVIGNESKGLSRLVEEKCDF